jgi:tripartite-type tricarboxylate transporter receptor subunit TctC
MHIVSISGFAEVDKLFGRPVKFTRDDFIPIARFIADPMVLVVNDQQPYKTLKEFVDDAKKRPNELIFSSSGLYGALHLPTALFMSAAGIQMKHLPTNGGGPCADGRPRQQQPSARVLDRGRERADEGRQAQAARLLRCPARARVARRADHEGARLQRRILSVGRHVRAQGHANAIINTMRDASKKAAADPKFVEAMKNLGQDVAYLDQAEFKAFWDADAKRVEDAVRQIGKVQGECNT